MTDSKKKWVKPELVILARNNPAEAVLGSCKNSANFGPTQEKAGCVFHKWDPQGCAACDSHTAS